MSGFMVSVAFADQGKRTFPWLQQEFSNFGGSPLDAAHDDNHAQCVPSFCEVGPKKFRRAEGSANEDDKDASLAKELTKLSMEEREEVLADLHGVADRTEENPEMLEQAFIDLEVEIGKIKKRGAYEKALFLDPSYVQNRDFRIKFLRADRFNPKHAAQRMVNHFDFKLDLFGYERLARDITFDDLNEEDQKDLLTGGYWFLKTPDRAGRRILLCTLEQIYKMNSTHYRLLWYLYMNAIEDPMTQKNGLVDLVYCVRTEKTMKDTQKPPFNLEQIVKAARLPLNIPVRLAALHICYDSDKKPPFLNIFQMAMDLKYRLRFRIHRGSPLEMKYELSGYGIPMQYLPLDSDGHLDLASHLRQVQERIVLEKKRKEDELVSGVINHPSEYDVLLGRGRPYQEFPGNIHLAQVVESHQEDYEAGERCDKAAVAKRVMQQIFDLGGRFLRRPEDSLDAVGWEEVDEETIKIKIGNTFRTKRKLEKRKEKAMKRKNIEDSSVDSDSR